MRVQLLCISITSHQKAYNVRKSLLVLYKFDHVAKCNNLRVPTGRYAFPFLISKHSARCYYGNTRLSFLTLPLVLFSLP